MFSQPETVRYRLHAMQNAFTRMMEAAEKLRGVKTPAEVGKLIGQYDQMMTNWKSRGIPSKEVLDIAKAIGCDPYWLRDGVGEMAADDNRVMEPGAKYETRDPILDDLAALEPEDAEVWRAQIRAAAVKARKIKQEETPKDRNAVSGPGDPSPIARRTA